MTFEIPQAVKTWSQFGHPLIMWGLLALSFYAFYTGSKSRKIRKADKEERKELIKGKFADKHFIAGSILLALMVLGTVGGMAVTYINNGKLFVGPHLLVGLGMTTIIAISASLVPLMQKGNEVARLTHISLNMSLVGLFLWQAVTGMQIVQRILEKMTTT